MLPFNSKNNFMAVICMDGDTPMLYIKGGSDVIMNMAGNAKALTMVDGEAKETPMAASLDEANENISEMSEAGERVLSFAEMPLSLDDLKKTGYTDGMTLEAAAEAIHLGLGTEGRGHPTLGP